MYHDGRLLIHFWKHKSNDLDDEDQKFCLFWFRITRKHSTEHVCSTNFSTIVTSDSKSEMQNCLSNRIPIWRMLGHEYNNSRISLPERSANIFGSTKFTDRPMHSVRSATIGKSREKLNSFGPHSPICTVFAFKLSNSINVESGICSGFIYIIYIKMYILEKGDLRTLITDIINFYTYYIPC